MKPTIERQTIALLVGLFNSTLPEDMAIEHAHEVLRRDPGFRLASEEQIDHFLVQLLSQL